MKKLPYIERFERLGLGLFVHFGLYSTIGQGEWYQSATAMNATDYSRYIDNFKIKKNWAKDLVATAKRGGFKYIVLTTRHHEGFSLFDTRGLSDFDALHSPTGRDLIREFADECHKADILPFFYHTLLDWHKTEYVTDFPAYLQYLRDSVEILCKYYGKVGGFWFDGWWDKKDADWEFDRLYGIIRHYQPDAMIINNTGLGLRGEISDPKIDCVTFERGKPTLVDRSKKYIAGEMCQTLNDHWGYAKNDFRYKTIEHLIGDLLDCRRFNCNFLLNTGLTGNGSLRAMDKAMLEELGNWIRVHKNVVYDLRGTDLSADNAQILTDGTYYYAVVSDIPMVSDPNVALQSANAKEIRIHTEKPIENAVWLDNEQPIEIHDHAFNSTPFVYGNSMGYRIARFTLQA